MALTTQNPMHVRGLIKVMACTATLALAGLAVAGCANSNAGGDPGARPLAPGQTCQGLKGELDRMVNKGTAQGSESGRYNQLLGQYLGARCHV